MTQTDRWLLPDAIEEVLPPRAGQVEWLRREGLDLFRRYGYELAMPPLAEFMESLQVGMGGDLDMLTCKVTDQPSGRMLGITPDLTQQVARMDAHSMPHPGVARYCYCAPVLHARKASLLSSRNPLQIGAEIYGSSDGEADLEIICLMVGLAQTAGLQNLTLDIGHVGLFQGLLQHGSLDPGQQAELFTLMRQRALPELKAWLEREIEDDDLRAVLTALPGWSGERMPLSSVRTRLQRFAVDGPLAELADLLTRLEDRLPGVRLHVDLAELRDYTYHTGLVFSLFHQGHGHAIAKGGRYDDTGRAYGRSRAATGFSADLKTLAALTSPAQDVIRRIYAPVAPAADALRQRIAQLRAEGDIVVQGFTGQDEEPADLRCTHYLIERGGQWQVVACPPSTDTEHRG